MFHNMPHEKKNYDYMEMPLHKNCFTTKVWTMAGSSYHLSGHLLFILKDFHIFSRRRPIKKQHLEPHYESNEISFYLILLPLPPLRICLKKLAI